MSRVLRYHPKADADLDLVTQYFATFSRSAALRFVDQYVEITQSLLEHPERGAVEPCDPAETLRRVIVPGFRNYLVYYRLSSSAVTVLHVFHSSRDLPALLSDSGDI